MTISRPTRFHFEADAAPNLAWVSGVLCTLLLVGGCRLCADCDDLAYPSYGGAWQRTHRDEGRVGSIFDPGGSRVSDLSQRAQSDGTNAKNRAEKSSGDATEDSDRDSTQPNPDQDRETLETDGEEPSLQEREQERRDLEKRYRNLQLEEIKHKRPDANAGEWQ